MNGENTSPNTLEQRSPHEQAIAEISEYFKRRLDAEFRRTIRGWYAIFPEGMNVQVPDMFIFDLIHATTIALGDLLTIGERQ